MRAQFVVEGEAVTGVTEHPGLRGYGQRAAAGAGSRWTQQPGGQGNRQRLRHVNRRLGVHVFVEQDETEEIQSVIIFRGDGEQVQGVGQAGGQIRAGGRQTGQRQIPACGVGNAAGVVQRIRPRQAAIRSLVVGIATDAQRTLPVAGNPKILKPADMPGFPERRIELQGIRHGQRLAESGDVGIEQRQGAGSAVAQGGGEKVAPSGAGGGCWAGDHAMDSTITGGCGKNYASSRHCQSRAARRQQRELANGPALATAFVW